MSDKALAEITIRTDDPWDLLGQEDMLSLNPESDPRFVHCANVATSGWHFPELGEIPSTGVLGSSGIMSLVIDGTNNWLLPALNTPPPVGLDPVQRRACEDAIRSLLASAGVPNWNGEGAMPVSKEAVNVAIGIIDKLPGEIAGPNIYADADGNIEFDWELENGTMFTLSVGGKGDIAVSSVRRDSADRLSAIEKDEEESSPDLVDFGLAWLGKMAAR